jgi:hypothetical protein
VLSGYYLDDHYNLTNPYGGGTSPGFASSSSGTAQLLLLSDTTTFGSSTVNQFSFSILRDTNGLGLPICGIGPTLASLGFSPPGNQ